MLACCISGCVSVNRFGFAIEGARCALDRIYYDSLNGQLKTIEPKWKGFANTYKILSRFNNFLTKLRDDGYNLPTETFKFDECTYEKDGSDTTEAIGGDEQVSAYEYIINYNNIIDSLKYLKEKDTTSTMSSVADNFKPDIQKEFENIKKNLLEDGCFYYARVLIACMKVLAMVYFCLFIITITLAGISLMFYACLKRQGYLITFMHILWNIIRFFMFSFLYLEQHMEYFF